MAVLKSKDGNDMLIDCCCGCDHGIRLKINKNDCNYYCFMTKDTCGRINSEGDLVETLGLFFTLSRGFYILHYEKLYERIDAK